jgi:uncharacterized protein (TIGR00369 family)
MIPEAGVPQWDRPAVLHGILEADTKIDGNLEEFYAWLGLRDAQNGVGIELDVFDELRNPWGIVHGGVTASLIDAAAVRAVPGGVALVDATVHYLAPSRIGPLSAVGTVLGRRAHDTVVRIEVRDLGRDRTTAIAIAAVR